MIRIPENGILYHGSYTEVAQIDLSLCRYGLDFGKGFSSTVLLKPMKNGFTSQRATEAVFTFPLRVC